MLRSPYAVVLAYLLSEQSLTSLNGSPPSEPYVKLALHTAQAFTNAPRRTRPLWSVVLAHGSADDSWHGTTLCCRPCPDRLGYARYDGGFDNLPLLVAGVDHRSDNAPSVPSR